jgi:hypothetical protein
MSHARDGHAALVERPQLTRSVAQTTSGALFPEGVFQQRDYSLPSYEVLVRNARSE